MSVLGQVERLLEKGSLGTSACLPGVPVATPSSIEEARELITVVSKDRVPSVFFGAGSKIGWAAQVQRPALAISTAKLSGVVEFEPGDGVLTALAGTPLSELEAVVHPHGLCITPAIPRTSNSTLGGIIAAGQSGVDRLLHGAMRLHVLGTRVVQLDGEYTRSGGRLVKNVSGYDIHRLLTGSFGSLGIIAEASLRLMTIPEDRRVFSVPSDEPDSLVKLAMKLLESGIRPEALIIDGADKSWELHVSLVGRRGHVESECALVAGDLSDASALHGESATEKLETLRQSEPNWNTSDVLHMAVLRTKLAELLARLTQSSVHENAVQYRIHPGLATIQIQSREPIPANELQQLRSSLGTPTTQFSLRRATPLSIDYLPESRDPVRDRLATKLRQTYDPANLLCTRPPLEPAL
jgi:glycolate oxidase FAD binding subunit